MSRPVLTFPARYCEYCGTQLVRKRRPAGYLEPRRDFTRRRYCDADCYAAAHPTPAPESYVPRPVAGVSFTTAYRDALAVGFDLLEEFDAVYECVRHGRLHCESCGVAV